MKTIPPSRLASLHLVPLLAAALAGCGPPQSVNRVNAEILRSDARTADAATRPLDAGYTDAPALPDATAGNDTTPLPSEDAALDTPAADATVEAPIAAADRTPDLPLAPDLPPDSPPPPDLTPDRAPDPPPGPSLTVTHAPAPEVTDLTVTGTLDWIHFGHQSATRRNRKATVPARIGVSIVGGAQLYAYDDRPIRFSWQDGTPDAQVTRTSEGISIGEAVGRGWEVRVQGDPARVTTLRLYVGAWNARARLTARLGENSPVAYNDATLIVAEPGQDRVYTVVFRPADNAQPLIVRWTLDVISATYGNVTIQAATLTDAPP